MVPEGSARLSATAFRAARGCHEDACRQLLRGPHTDARHSPEAATARRHQPLNDPCHGWQLPTQGDDVLGCGAGVVKGSDAELGADSGEGYEGVPDVDGKRAAADCELFCDFGLGRPVAQ